MLLTKEENPVEGCRVVWDISRSLQVLVHRTMPLSLEGQHKVTVNTTKTDTHPITPQPDVLQIQACCLHTNEIQK